MSEASEQQLISTLVTPIIHAHRTAWLTYEHLANLFESSVNNYDQINYETSCNNMKTSGLTSFGRYFRLLSQRMRDNQSRWMDYSLMCDVSLHAALSAPIKPWAELGSIREPIEALKLSKSMEHKLSQLYTETIKQCDENNLFELRNFIHNKFQSAQTHLTTCISFHVEQLHRDQRDHHHHSSSEQDCNPVADYLFDRLTIRPVTEEISFDLIRTGLCGRRLNTIEKLELLVQLAHIFHLRESPMHSREDAVQFTPLKMVH
ncbi:hypothetical protein PHET_08894 [Paragonimus heterotremus]|uniref:Ferritin/DPS domain-containing protein n=1 Tax=Paragonimus heterotremus TaxID=100268 RepID=A0A8J4WSY9_9TREM|nr:hypothetical protein PHET_08894 [Paragonimus heterotremus]